jgi:hypothetical protein
METPLTTPGTLPYTRVDASQAPLGHPGYPEFTSFVASDQAFFILRRFSRLSARVLLALQDEIVQLETRLDEIEKCLAHPNLPHVQNGTFRNDTDDKRGRCIRQAIEGSPSDVNGESYVYRIWEAEQKCLCKMVT